MIEDTIVKSRRTGKTFFADARTAEKYKKQGTHDIIARQRDGSYQRRLEQEKKESARKVMDENRATFEQEAERRERLQWENTRLAQRDRKVMTFVPK